jgi:hypothetical protein
MLHTASRLSGPSVSARLSINFHWKNLHCVIHDYVEHRKIIDKNGSLPLTILQYISHRKKIQTQWDTAHQLNMSKTHNWKLRASNLFKYATQNWKILRWLTYKTGCTFIKEGGDGRKQRIWRKVEQRAQPQMQQKWQVWRGSCLRSVNSRFDYAVGVWNTHVS